MGESKQGTGMHAFKKEKFRCEKEQTGVKKGFKSGNRYYVRL